MPHPTVPEERAYASLAEALDRLPNGFPRTPGGEEIRLLREIYTPEEALIASHLGRAWEPVATVAERLQQDPERIQSDLFRLVEKGLVWPAKREGGLSFRLAPFVIGIYEAQLTRMDPALARLVDDYMDAGGAAGLMAAEPALHRVVPAQDALKPEWILPYDDVRALLDEAKSFYVRDCICRVHMEKLDQRCTFPLRTCLTYYTVPRPASTPGISREEAFEILAQAEEAGLVHTVGNVQTGSLLPKGVGYVCNCCGCCCMVLRGINKWGIAQSVAHAAYWARIDAELCTECGACVSRCQVGALLDGEAGARIDRERCIGCGLCVTSCPTGALRLERRPEAQTMAPPLDFEAWQDERMRNRKAAATRGRR